MNSKPITVFRLKAHAGTFKCHEPYKRKNFYVSCKGVIYYFQQILVGLNIPK